MSLTPCLDVSSPLTMGGGGYKTLLSPPGQPSHLQGWGLQKDPPCACGRAGGRKSCMSNYPRHAQQDPSFAVSPRVKICFLLAR